MAKKLDFTLSEDSRLLIAKLEQAQIGDLLSLATLSKVIGKPIAKHRGALYTAQRAVLAKGIVFGTERGVGIRRLNDEEIVSSTTSVRRAIRAKAMRTIRKLDTVDYNVLPKTKQISYTVAMALFSAVHIFSREKSAQMLSTKADSRRLDFSATLEAFRPSKTSDEVPE